ncbi:MAG: acylneuraminate cytidylyltransferase family protein [Phycisphaerales bacterium]|jgi:CMP-N-acetylneuraminic acid synthetase
MAEKAKIIAVIPARGGSKGIARKNIKPLDNKPLIYYAIELAQKAEGKGIILDHIVSTDDREIASIAEQIGGNVPFLRPHKLATDDSPVIDAITHAVRWWEKSHQKVLHSVLLLQPTNPLTILKDIEDSTKHYLNNQPNAKCLISICDAQHVRLSTLYYKRRKFVEIITKNIGPEIRRQDLRKVYWRNGAVYMVRRDMLLEEKKVIGDNPLFYEMPRSRSITIDDTFDWMLAELLMGRRKK